MLRWHDERERLHAEVKRTGSVDSNAVTRAAFQVAVHRLFSPDADLQEITKFVTDVHQAFGDDVPVLETEALIRQALGEDVPTSDIDPWSEMKGKTATLLGAADFLSWTQQDVDEVLAEAETIVKKNGFNPTIASEA